MWRDLTNPSKAVPLDRFNWLRVGISSNTQSNAARQLDCHVMVSSVKFDTLMHAVTASAAISGYV